MSQEAREVKALALLDYYEHKQDLAVLREKINENAELLIIAGTELKEDPAQYAGKQYTILQSKIDNLVQEWQELTDKTEQLRQKAASFGLAI